MGNLNILISQLSALNFAESELDDILGDFHKRFSPECENEDLLRDLTLLFLSLNREEIILRITQQKLRRIFEETNVTILALIRDEILKKRESQFPIKLKDKNPTTKNKRLAFFLSIAMLGTIFAAFDGASIIQSIISAFTVASIPSIILLPAQILFAGVAILAFYVFELSTIGKVLGIKALELGKIFKLYAEQSKIYKEIFTANAQLFNICKNEAEFDYLNKTHTYLSDMYSIFGKKVTEAKNAQKPTRPKTILRRSLTATAAIIFGTIAAVNAQPVIATTLPLIIGATAAAGPVGLIATIVIMALCAFTVGLIYVLLERKGENLVNKLWGTPTKAVKRLISRDADINEKLHEIEIIQGAKQEFFQQQNQLNSVARKIPDPNATLVQMPTSEETPNASVVVTPENEKKTKTNYSPRVFATSKPLLPEITFSKFDYPENRSPLSIVSA